MHTPSRGLVAAALACSLACTIAGTGHAQTAALEVMPQGPAPRDATPQATALKDAAPRFGELPAVSALNGKFALSGGVESGPGSSTAAGNASGALTAPLGHAFGLQVDADASTGDGSISGAGTAHLFWRDPTIGLVGTYVSIDGRPNGRFGWYAGEAELYAGLLTLAASAGYRDASGASGAAGTQSGGFYTSRLTVYPMPDLALTAGFVSAVSHLAVAGGLEFQPTLGRQHNLSFFVNAEAGEQSSYAILAGVRFYFGADKTLIRRHREDDPYDPYWTCRACDV